MAAAATEREAKEALSTGDFARSIQLYTEVINAGHPTADLYAERALALVKHGNYHEALDDANKAIDLNPGVGKAYYRKAAALLKLEEYERAKIAIQEGKANAPNYPKFSQILENYHKSIIEEAKEALNDGDFELAAELFTEAIDDGPATADLYADRSRALIELGEYDEALDDANKAIDLNPGVGKAYYRKAAALWKLEEYERAKIAIQEGKANAPNYPKFSQILENYHKSIIEEAKEALNDGDFELATELFTEAIDDGPATADLYADRSRALIKLGEYDEAVADTDRAINLDPTFLRAYLLKFVARYMLKDYPTAKAALEQGLPYGSGDPRLASFLEKCDQRIAEEVNQNVKMDSTKSGEAWSQARYRYYYYNTVREVVLIICAKASNAVIRFEEQMLNVSFDVLGENPYQLQVELSSKIIPQNCIYQVFCTNIEIRLAKVEHLTWTTLSTQRMTTSADYEFSWKDKPIDGQNMLPSVRDQGRTETCTFHALSAAAEIEVMMENARTQPHEPCKVRFSTNDFIADYERTEEYLLDDNSKNDIMERALTMFKEKGVLATSRGKTVTREKRKIKGFRERKNARFQDIKKLIRKGRAVVGGIKVDETFGDEKPGVIYDYDCTRQEKGQNGAPIGHAVVFVGYGVRNGRAYLVFLNSHGDDYCEGGFGRVYFGHAFGFYTIDV